MRGEAQSHGLGGEMFLDAADAIRLIKFYANLSFLNKLNGFELDTADSSRSISLVKYFWAIMDNKAFVKEDTGFDFLASGHSAEQY
ncbi:uncharacterized protein MONOS_17500 [Monocercomonoides exilis]|uniref:uncharacterized protein n=1 Tax=Monocercomonoides exilis TaxID=2049356 RepID=UPI00355A7F73|nr:hypothetical protein MONOS_17500 [Monocercomonoides exilis]